MNIKDIIKKEKVNGVIITSLFNIRYLTNFNGTTATLLHTTHNKYLFVDSRYYEQALIQTKDTNTECILVTNQNMYDYINKIIVDLDIRDVGFESNNLSYAQYSTYCRSLMCVLKPIEVDDIRILKNEIEINIIKKACFITELTFQYVLDNIQVGMSEKEVEKIMYNFITDQGCDSFSFKTIIASGVRSSLPHGVASDKIIEENDFITFDFGVLFNGYCSDMTRTICIGTNPDKKLVDIYNVVLNAQLKTIEAIRPGLQFIELDSIARNYIRESGYGDYFTHGLGHSFGMEIHEKPYLNQSSLGTLVPGMVITIEPGIYIPNLGGVRIEDDVLITNEGFELLTNFDKNLILIDRSIKND